MLKIIYRLLIVVYLPLAGCTVTSKPVVKDAGLYVSANELPVKVRDGWLTAKTLSLGSYTTSSRTNGIAANTPAKQLRNVSDAFYFTVKAPEAQIPVQVLRTPRITFSNRPLPGYLNTLPGDASLWYVHIGAAAADPLKSWELILKSNVAFLELNDNKPVGVLRSATDEIRVTAHNHFGIKNSAEKVCYEFHLRGVPVAAVMPGETPKVWMQAKVDAALQQTLASAMLALAFK